MGETWAGGGSFRVDPARALEILSRYQLAQPEAFLLGWARCAVLAGASSLMVREEGDETVLSFGGRPLPRADFADPLQALVAGEEGDEGGRHLLFGMLAAFRAGVSRVRVLSGPRGSGFEFSAEAPDRHALSDGPGLETELRARWTPGARAQALRALALLRERTRMLPIPLIFAHGEPAHEPDPGGCYELAWGTQTLRGTLRVPRDPYAVISELSLYQLGVFAGRIPERLPLAQVEAHVNCDEFRLNASQSGVVAGPALAGALDAARAQIEPMLEAAAGACERRYAEIGCEAARALHRGTRPPSEFLEWEHTARWLRGAASAERGRRLLRERRLFLDVSGKPVSLAELDGQRQHLNGRVPVAEHPNPRSMMAICVPWATGEARTCLEAAFPGGLLELSDLQLERGFFPQ